MKKLLFVILLSFSILHSNAQNFLVSGFITDDETGEPLIGASVYEPELKTGSTTNNMGFYMIYLPAGTRSLQFSYLGYAVQQDSFFIGKNLSLNVKLVPDELLDEVVVKDNQSELFEDSPITSSVTIPAKQIARIPAVFGEIDLVKAVQLLPGVQAGIEGGSGLYVRGGSPDQNYILIDGVPVYNINHLFGMFSSFNNAAVSNFNLYKGGFPARFGSRLSSVLDITMKEGNNQEFSGNASIGLMAVSAFLEGPIYKDKTTIAISGRRSLLDVLLGGLVADPAADAQQRMFFYDVTGKITHRFSDKDKLFLSFYHGKDKLAAKMTERYQNGATRIEDTYEDDINWGNLTTSLRWNHVIGPKFLSSYSFSFTRYQFNIEQGQERKTVNDTMNQTVSYLLKYFSGIRDFSLKADYELSASKKHYLRFGAVYINHQFAPGAIQAKFNVPGQSLDTVLGPTERILTTEAAVYLEDDITVNARLRFNIGLRVSAYFVEGKEYYSPEPRLSMRYYLNSKWAMKTSYSYMNQYLHLLTNSGFGMPTDLWVPATARIKPQNSHQGVLGLARTLKHNFEFSIEGYYKSMGNVIDYAEGADFINTQDNWEDKVEQGKGESYGVELLIQRKSGKISGWIGYTLSWNKRQFENINNGNEFYFRYDRRHYLAAAAMLEINERNILSHNIVFGSGQPITFPQGRYYDIDGQVVYDYGEKNGYRMRNYIRFDFGYTNIKNKDDRFEQQMIISVYNMLNRFNPFYMYVGADANGNPTAKEVSLFPFVFPSITYLLKF